jgi:hypothetical protein
VGLDPGDQLLLRDTMLLVSSSLDVDGSKVHLMIRCRSMTRCEAATAILLEGTLFLLTMPVTGWNRLVVVHGWLYETCLALLRLDLALLRLDGRRGRYGVVEDKT